MGHFKELYDMMKWQDYVDDRSFEKFVEPTVKVPKNSTIFSFGGCVNRDIEESLKHEYFFPFLSYTGVGSEFVDIYPTIKLKTTGILNKNTPASIVEELEWFIECENDFEKATWDKFAYEEDGDKVIDTGMRGYVPVTVERFYERRKEVYEIYKHMRTASLIFLVYGQVEQKFYKNKPLEHFSKGGKILENAINVIPDENIVIEQVVYASSLVRNINPKSPIVLSVVAAPNISTLSNKHIFIANFEDKIKLLRATKMSNDYYFPMYEMTASLGNELYDDWDERHWTKESLRDITMAFKKFISLE